LEYEGKVEHGRNVVTQGLRIVFLRCALLLYMYAFLSLFSLSLLLCLIPQRSTVINVRSNTFNGQSWKSKESKEKYRPHSDFLGLVAMRLALRQSHQVLHMVVVGGSVGEINGCRQKWVQNK